MSNDHDHGAKNQYPTVGQIELEPGVLDAGPAAVQRRIDDAVIAALEDADDEL